MNYGQKDIWLWYVTNLVFMHSTLGYDSIDRFALFNLANWTFDYFMQVVFF
jgi:hypothetical protein